jgi:CRISPR-associated protein Cmr4
MSNGNAYKTVRFLLMTTDPVHVGTGGSRLGRVDNSIVREPGTRLPKIPGTSLSGAIRQYAAYRNGRRECAGQKPS